MNKIVRENYPVEKLPEDLRKELHDATPVKVSVEQEEPQLHVSPGQLHALGQGDARAGHFSRWRHLRRAEFASAEEIVDHVRALREEWDRR